MPSDSILALAVVAAIANVLLTVAVVLPGLVARDADSAADEVPSAAALPPPALGTASVTAALGDELPPLSYDRLVRVTAWIFILAAAAAVVGGGLWIERQPAILVLLGFAGLVVLVAHDLLPVGTPARAKYVVEGAAAITFASLLVLLTGRTTSPFFIAFLLIVGAAAFAAPGRAAAAFTTVAAAGYAAAALAPVTEPGPDALGLATVAVNVTVLGLVAYVSNQLAGEHRRSRSEAMRLATIDPLTGLFNRTFFFAAVEREIARSDRSGRGFCVLMVDLDDLKVVNDRFGHLVGDRLLEAVGRIIRTGVRRMDTAARYGGDEFVILLPETDRSGGVILAEKIRQGAGALRVPVGGGTIAASLSVGVAAYPMDGLTVDELLAAADQAMYVAKRRGREAEPEAGWWGPGTGGPGGDRGPAVRPTAAPRGWPGRGGRIEIAVGRAAYRR